MSGEHILFCQSNNLHQEKKRKKKNTGGYTEHMRIYDVFRGDSIVGSDPTHCAVVPGR